MDTADVLAEVEAIKRLKARYFRTLDTKDWAAWRSVFTDDVEVRTDITVARPGEPAETLHHPAGGDAFVAHISAYLAEHSTVHHGHMPEIQIVSPTEATGIWSMEDIVEDPDGRILRGYGHYHERYRKEDNTWRIASLYLTRLRIDYSQRA